MPILGRFDKADDCVSHGISGHICDGRSLGVCIWGVVVPSLDGCVVFESYRIDRGDRFNGTVGRDVHQAIQSDAVSISRDILAVEKEFREAGRTTAQMVAELERVDSEVKQIAVPLSYADALYDLRLHIELVRENMQDGKKTE